jgi:hypothetical protein
MWLMFAMAGLLAAAHLAEYVWTSTFPEGFSCADCSAQH